MTTKRYNGATFSSEMGSRAWNGSMFVLGVARVWDGTQFVPLSGGAPPAETFYILDILTESGDRLLQE